MKGTISRVMSASIGMAALVYVAGPAASAAQSATAQSAPAQGQGQAAAAEQQVTVTGCILREADYRKTAGAGRGGVAATGVGVANEFVLANAVMSTGTGSVGTTGAGASSRAGTAEATAAYELTGPNEAKAATLVGKRVEVTGKMKPARAGAPGGPTADVVGSQDLKLRELEMGSIRETAGACTPTP